MSNYDSIKLENQLCFSLYALSREVIKLYKPLLDPFGLTYTQYITMLVMWEEETILFKDLGQKLHLDSGTLTPVVKKLEAMKFVTKHRNKEDDRVVTVVLTERGRQLREDILGVPEKMACHFRVDLEELFSLKHQLDELLVLIGEQREG